MTVQSVGSGNTELVQLLQQAARQQESQQKGPATGGLGVGPFNGAAGSSGRPNPFEEKLQAFAEEAGLDEATISSLQDDLRAAVSSVVSETGSESDRRAAIDDAVKATLEKHGLDGDSFISELQAERESFMQRQGGVMPSLRGASQNSGWAQLLAAAGSGGVDGAVSAANVSVLNTVG
jgi:hypothetical protein